MDMMALRRAVMIGGIVHFVEDTATGNPCVFTTDLAKPLRKLSLSLLPRQSGTGDPSPENIRPLIPWGEVGTWHDAGGVITPHPVNLRKNLVNATGSSTYLSRTDGVYTITSMPDVNKSFGVGQVTLKEGETYILSGGYSQAFRLVCRYNGTNYISAKGESVPFTATGDDTVNVTGVLETGASVGQQVKPMLRLASETDDTFQPYLPPVYGCSVDLTTGEVWGTWASFSAKWKDGTQPSVRGSNTRKMFSLPNIFVQASGSVTAYCNVAKWEWDYEIDNIHFYLNRGTSYIFLPNDTDGETDIFIVGKLETPVLLATLTPQQINALIGVNTVWSDADGIELTYLKKG